MPITRNGDNLCDGTGAIMGAVLFGPDPAAPGMRFDHQRFWEISKYIEPMTEPLFHRDQVNVAVAEFKKILDHPGVVLNEPIGALTHLQIGRAYAMQGDAAKARVAYQDFLTLWKNADRDIPILIAAKSEYAKLK